MAIASVYSCHQCVCHTLVASVNSVKEGLGLGLTCGTKMDLTPLGLDYTVKSTSTDRLRALRLRSINHVNVEHIPNKF